MRAATPSNQRLYARFFSSRRRKDFMWMRPETLLGVALIAAGVILVLLGLAPRLIRDANELHPLIYTHFSLDGVKIGVSPLLTLILTILYVVFVLRAL